jgi:glycosyltransferase involved in cell wall biosynthesis
MIERNSLDKGKISVIMVTYNRGHMITKSIDSLLAQTYKNFEIIIVDNGSKDNTPDILKRYDVPKYHEIIRIFRLEENRRFTGGGNFGFEQITGEWFTMLDDDDLAYPEAFETMLAIPDEIDPKIDAITCNCIDTSTGKFSGKGPVADQYLTFEDTVKLCDGEFWGITKTQLIRDARFNEKLLGYEDTFWYQINERANRYYIHKALRIWDTDHGPTITQLTGKKNRTIKADIYRILADENIYWDCHSAFLPGKFRSKCLKGLLYLYMDDDLQGVKKYLKKLKDHSKISTLLARASLMIPSPILRSIFSVIPL